MGGLRGYSLYGQDSDSFYYDSADTVLTCPSCGLVIDHEWINPNFKLKRRQLDLSHTWDGVTIVSAQLADFVAVEGGAHTVPLPMEPDHSLLIVDRTVRFDSVARGTTFESPCDECGRFGVVAGATPVRLVEGEVLEPGFSGTDIVFGSAGDTPSHIRAQRPVLLVDADLGNRLGSSKFSGLALQPIVDKS